MVIPVDEVDNNGTNVDELVNQLTSSGPGEDAQTSNHNNNSNGASNNDGKCRRHLNHRLIFTLQLPLMLFSLAVVAFLAGLLAIVFGALGSADGGSDDDRKIAVLFGVVVVFLICVSYSSSHWLYKIPVPRPEPSFNV
ncbi:MAG: hypothetical protein LQ344_003848 [Seirophora lacunosa]|nr:MAG: hypothetical protein LQ344_003848 [Seirophora lacunosa]